MTECVTFIIYSYKFARKWALVHVTVSELAIVLVSFSLHKCLQIWFQYHLWCAEWLPLVRIVNLVSDSQLNIHIRASATAMLLINPSSWLWYGEYCWSIHSVMGIASLFVYFNIFVADALAPVGARASATTMLITNSWLQHGASSCSMHLNLGIASISSHLNTAVTDLQPKCWSLSPIRSFVMSSISWG